MWPHELLPIPDKMLKAGSLEGNAPANSISQHSPRPPAPMFLLSPLPQGSRSPAVGDADGLFRAEHSTTSKELFSELLQKALGVSHK